MYRHQAYKFWWL